MVKDKGSVHEVAKCRDLGTEQQQQTRFAACLA